jgi:signal transduction histidine kinase
LAATIDGMLAALERAHHELEGAHSAQRLFLADISHELRTPLTIMLSSLDLLGRPGATDPEFQTKALADMRVEARRMARMVTQLLIMARSDAGATVAHQPVLVVDTLSDACRQLSPDGGVTLRCHGLEALDQAVVQGVSM